MRAIASAAALAAVCALGAGRADAAIITYSWDVTGPYTGPGEPFGLPTNPEITGSVDIDTTLGGGFAAFTAINYTTGTQVWTLADILPTSFVTYDLGGSLIQVQLLLQNGLAHSEIATSSDFFGVSDGASLGILCAGCVAAGDTVADIRGESGGGLNVIPEPATWAMMLVGFAGLGAAIRRRRALLVA